jgi:hypothetical protein
MRHLLAPVLLGIAIVAAATVFVNVMSVSRGVALAIALTAMAIAVLIGLRADQRHAGVETRSLRHRKRPAAR